MPYGRCLRCGREYYRPEPCVIVCPCYKMCPLEGYTVEMTEISPDFNPETYRNEKGFDFTRTASSSGQADRSDMTIKTCYVCTNHSPPYYSSMKPVEVKLR